MLAKLAEAQLVADGTYPNAAAVFAEGGTAAVGDAVTADAPGAGAGALHYLTEPRNRTDPGEKGRWIEGEDDSGDLLTLAGLQHERERRRRRAKRLKRQARKRELEERRRQKAAEGRGGSEEAEEPDPKRAENPSAPPEDEPEKTLSKPLIPHSSLPDMDRDETELPLGATQQDVEEVHLQGSPVGISFQAEGKSTTAYGNSYSDAVNAYRGAQRPPKKFIKGSSNPDGAMLVQSGNKQIVIESKYIRDWSRFIYNPNLDVPFLHSAVNDVVYQSKKYADDYDQVDWYTNSLEFARTYAKKFREAGIENFTFTIIPATKVK